MFFQLFCIYCSPNLWLSGLGYLACYYEVRDWAQRWILTFFFLWNFQNSKKFQFFFVYVPFCQLVRIWTLFLSICIDSKDLQSNFEVPVACGSIIFPLPSTVIVHRRNYIQWLYLELPFLMPQYERPGALAYCDNASGIMSML